MSTRLLLRDVWRSSAKYTRWGERQLPPLLTRGYKGHKVHEYPEGLKLDYPNLPWISAQERPPKGWWDNQDRRNKGDVLHEQDDILSMWVCDIVETNGRYTKYEALAQLMLAFALLGGVYGLSRWTEATFKHPAVPRQFPYNNLYLSRGGNPNKQPPPGYGSQHMDYSNTYIHSPVRDA